MNSRKLQQAFLVWQQCKEMSNRAKGSAIERLAPLGFSVVDISVITGVKIYRVAKILGQPAPRPPFEKWDSRLLDTMYLMAYRFEEENIVTRQAILFAVKNGVALRTLARLTGIPLERIREELGND